MARIDPHSFSDDTHPRTQRFDWSAQVDFATKRLRAEVTLHLDRASGGALDLDTRGLSIESVTTDTGATVPHRLHPADPILGARLELTLPSGARAVTLRYLTAPDASALQWLEPAMTSGGQKPYLFSQCQAIHARSIFPCQDTPAFRVEYSASLTVPVGLSAVMAAAFKSRSEGPGGSTFSFQMPQPIPPYLFAFAVGDLVSRDLSPRTRVWCEPAQLELAAWEFAGVERQICAAEALFGPYDWERFDLLVMPPSFPYGGMENPRLTFLTPALLSGDRSQVNVVAHELAHSWTGNLVTNANAEHFWLNEGFTVFAERRILEALEGPEKAALHAALGFRELQAAVTRFAKRPELTKLRTHLTGVDPDEAFSVVPYEKGYLFLKALEADAGRERFDLLLKHWLEAHRFGVATTEEFLAHVEREAPGLLARVDAPRWIEGAGIPVDEPPMRSDRLAEVRALAGQVLSKEVVRDWSPTEWQLYLESMPRPAPASVLEALEKTFSLTATENPEVLVAWLTLAAESGFAPARARTEELLQRFGRMKYLRPLYKALATRLETRPSARAIFERCRSRYHPIAQHVVAGLLTELGA